MKKLREIRKERGMSQEDLAREIGVNYRTISTYEIGTRELSVKHAKKIGEVFKIDWWTLYED